jgi:iron complex transport system permease protein
MSRAVVLTLLAVLLVAVAAAAPFVGAYPVAIESLWQVDGTAARILWNLRLPRVALGLLAGAGLALSGMVFQGLFRNVLATPFTLGVASGASLGAVLYIHLGLSFTLLGTAGSSWFAFGGAVLTIALVYGLTRARRGFSTSTMLLAGLAISFFFSSLILLVQYLSDFPNSFLILRWMMGGLEKTVRFDDVFTVLPFVAAGAILVVYLTNELNLLTTGEELAASRGVEVHRTKVLLFFAVSLMVGAIVAVCGPIGFVGLMVPHICRILIGPDHRYLTPATLLFGAAFLTACDAAARTIMVPQEVPVGILTALLGGPFFLWLLLGRSLDSAV